MSTRGPDFPESGLPLAPASERQSRDLSPSQAGTCERTLSAGPTIAELYDRWRIPGAGNRHAAPVSRHWQKTRASLAKHLLAVASAVALEELGPRHIWAVQEYCRGRDLSAETCNKITHHLLPAMLRDLELSGEIPVGSKARVMAGARKLRAESVSDGVALTIEERDKLLAAFGRHWTSPLAHFLFFTGMRVGEALGLRQCDIDWSRRLCRISRSRRRKDLSATKSRRSQRTIELPRAALAVLHSLRRDYEPNAFVFVGPLGHPIDADTFRRRHWNRVVEKSGVRKIRIHDTRHTFATLALEASIPVAKVARYLGDKVSTVEARYDHVLSVGDWDRAVTAPRLRGLGR